jgi:signal transduction histidine kinase/CheY-like chemotaxis protein
MAGSAKAGDLRTAEQIGSNAGGTGSSARPAALFLWLLCLTNLPAAAQPTLSLEDASARKPPEFTPLHEDRAVVVTGQVSIKPVRLTDFFHVAIQERGHGLILEGVGTIFDHISPGDWVEAHGRIARRAGLPVVVVSKIVPVSTGAPPLPVPLSPANVQNLKRLGQLVVTEGTVIEAGSNFGGAYLRMGDYSNPLKVFLPVSPNNRRGFAGFAVGETVRVTGVAYQYCPVPPHLDQFELLIDDVTDVVHVNRSWIPPRQSLWPILLVLAAMGFLWWRREITSKQQQERLRTIYHLGEEILSAASSVEILAKITQVLTKVLPVSGARLYLYDRGTKSLNPVGLPQAAGIPLDSPSGLAQTSAVTCFQNRSSLSIPDTRRHPFSSSEEEKASLPRALLFVPMQSQGEPIGVFQVENNQHSRNLSPDEQAVAQHLANQIGLAVKLLQQRSFREQLSRSEKLAAVGRLISGVVNDLQTPLEAISSMADSALEQHTGSPPGHELLVIASEARRATALVTRLVSFAQPEQVQAEPVQLNRLLRNLIQFREREWKACGIQLRNLVKDLPLCVLGSEGQLEQVFLNLFVHAEQSLEDAPEKQISVRTDVLAKRVFIEIGYSAPLQRAGTNGHAPGEISASGEVSALGLDICRSIVAGHGGELHITSTSSGAHSVFEIELPGVPLDQLEVKAPPAEPSQPSRRWTALMLEPEEFVERRLVEWLSNRGYRVVPVRSSEEGLDLVQRMRFDVVFCSTELRGLNWVEFFDRVRGRVTAFALLAEAFSQDLSTHFRGEGRYVFHKPIEPSQFDRTLVAIESRLLTVEVRTPEVESY